MHGTENLCLGYPVAVRSIDSLAATFGCPTHIKIDIDGQELKVVLGMMATLKRPEFRSALVEVEIRRRDIGPAFLVEAISDILLPFFSAGFTTENRFNTMPNHSRIRRAKENILVENIVFTRE
jgi:hypothetical protein